MRAAMMVAAAAAAMLGGCSEAQKPKEGKAQSLEPGEYEVAIKVDKIRSTNNTTPLIKAKAGDSAEPRRVCVAADGKIDPKLFTEEGDSCTPQTNYVRRERINIQYQCSRPGQGPLGQMIDGKFTKDSFEAKGTTSTYFSGTGDYELVRSFTGRRVGECSAAPAPAAG